MYYDDEARQFNFVSGLLFGAVLGVGLALLGAPQRRVRGRGRQKWRKQAGRKLDRLREGVADSVSEAVTTGRKYLRR